MKRLSLYLLICIALLSSCSSEQVSKEREKQIADSVTQFLTRKTPIDSSKIKKIEDLKTQLKELEEDTAKGIENKKADVALLKSISFDYDYDQKMFNKKSDIDGHIFNNSKEITFKNFTFKINGKDKKGNSTKTFVHTVCKIVRPNQSTKFTIRFVDPEKTIDAKMSLISADVE